MPFLTAFSLMAETGGLVKINRSMSSVTKSASYNPFRPLYPVKLHSLHPFSLVFAIFILPKSGTSICLGRLCNPFLISDNSLADGFEKTEHFLQAFLTSRW